MMFGEPLFQISASWPEEVNQGFDHLYVNVDPLDRNLTGGGVQFPTKVLSCFTVDRDHEVTNVDARTRFSPPVVHVGFIHHGSMSDMGDEEGLPLPLSIDTDLGATWTDSDGI